MSKLIMFNLITLDGFFEGVKSWDLDWHQYAFSESFERFSIEQLNSADMLLFGRITYEGMAGYWRTAEGEVADLMNKLPKVVVSRTLERADWANTTLVKEDPVAAVSELKRLGKRNIIVIGSANLSGTLINAGLFDEYCLRVVSAVLGKGRPLFPERMDRLRLNLIESRPLSAGCIVLRYEPVKTNR